MFTSLNLPLIINFSNCTYSKELDPQEIYFHTIMNSEIHEQDCVNLFCSPLWTLYNIANSSVSHFMSSNFNLFEMSIHVPLDVSCGSSQLEMY